MSKAADLATVRADVKTKEIAKLQIDSSRKEETHKGVKQREDMTAAKSKRDKMPLLAVAVAFLALTLSVACFAMLMQMKNRDRTEHEEQRGRRGNNSCCVAAENRIHTSHLVLDTSQTTEDNLVWTSFPINAHNSAFSNTLYNDNILVIPTSGTYFFYTQLTFAGKRKKNNISCSFQVVLSDDKLNERILMYSITTQLRMGRRLHVDRYGHDMYPEDSTYTSGVFLLEVGDELKVKLDDDSLNDGCMLSKFDERTFLGLVKLA